MRLVEYLMNALTKILGQIRKARRLLLMSDFDGTLAAIAEQPEKAVMPENTRLLLQKLSVQPRVKVGIISGRALADLKSKVNIEGVIYAGNHGFEIQGPGLNFINPIADEIIPVFRVVRQILNMTTGSIKGVFVEDKGVTLSVHYRQADESRAEAVPQIVEHSVRIPLLAGLLKLTHGKKVVEVRPAVDWDKGRAIRLLMKRYGKGGRRSGLLPIYIGDDLTDEDGFKVIDRYGEGISIHIGDQSKDSAAKYYLNSSDEVPLFLNELLETRKRGFAFEQLSILY
jgi:trehalose 6-phosphate phosphatase